ncbi:alpha/beta hydrolase [Sphingobacterium olei]|uniref:Alpha/beta hydrolase n=1 Tax=Sphingobacterium olei TaxID=2571155 RepID=A0A4U0NHK0_9SPHI|nr:alpha/beta hydrolase fold domain-containing protein [Sphingobacterium olei]TJZ53697.1 alpha/beta hydrolase [Sphingobacterium olei]
MSKQYLVNDEIASVLAVLVANAPKVEPLRKGDWKTLRIETSGLDGLFSAFPDRENINVEKFETETKDGASIDLYWVSKKGVKSNAAVIYTHGGGRVAGSALVYLPFIKQYVDQTDVSFLVVDYRLAPEVQGEMQAEDIFSAIQWLLSHADELDVDGSRIGIMGDSGGGGIAASAAILCRERNVAIAKQILIYPMLDNRNITPDEKLVPFVTWDYNSNYTGWKASLGETMENDNLSPIAVPAYLTDFKDLPGTYIEVGFLDIFRNESIAYANELCKAGVELEFHIHPGVPHAYDLFAPNSAISKQAFQDRVRVLKSI